MPVPRLRRQLLLATALSALTGAARALAVPRGRVVLTVSGKISQRNVGESAEFDLDMLAALPRHSFTTLTPWDKTARRFSGPLLRDVLQAVGARGQTLQAVALNDYKISIPVTDAQAYNVIVATRIDDQPIRVRERGPLFIIYPYDTDPALRTGIFISRSIWQLRRIDVL